MEKWLTELEIISPQILLQSDREAVVEGCKGIIEYNDEFIQIAAKKMQLKFYGKNLSVRCLNTENMIITGEFERIEYLK